MIFIIRSRVKKKILEGMGTTVPERAVRAKRLVRVLSGVSFSCCRLDPGPLLRSNPDGRFGLMIAGRVLLASGFGDEDTGGGLFCFEGDRIEIIDPVSTTGLAAREDRLLRLLRSTSDAASVGELLVYDTRGVERYCRIDALHDAHDIQFDGEGFVAVSAFSNRILWIASDGRVTGEWKAPGEGDAWHLNCLAKVSDEWFVSAFGKFRGHREWSEKAAEPSGLIYNVNKNREAVTGLHHPHNPRLLGTSWLVCNSIKGELVEIDRESRTEVRRLTLKGYTRGLASAGDLLFVGESANRNVTPLTAMASIAVVDSTRWRVIDRIPLPCREIYDLVLVSPELADGVKRGFRTNPGRVAEMDQLMMFDEVGIRPVRLWAVTGPLPQNAFKVRITAQIPARMTASEHFSLSCTIQNTGEGFFLSAPPNPVNVSYRWVRNGKPLPGHEPQRTRLPQPLPPGQVVDLAILGVAPTEAGTYVLIVTLVQEGVAWFCDVDEENAARSYVDVRESDQPDPTHV